MDDDREDDMEEHEAGDEEAEEVLYSKMYLNGMVKQSELTDKFKLHIRVLIIFTTMILFTTQSYHQ